MRAVSGGILVAIGLVLFYLITTGKLAAALAAFKVLSSGQASNATGPAQSDATKTAGPSQFGTPAPLSSLPAAINPFSSPYTPLPALTQPATPTLVH